jgi:hypothetical protein
MKLLGIVAGLPFCASVFAQPLVLEDFEDAEHQGWTVNGNEMTFPDDRGGAYMGVPYLDFQGIILRNERSGSPVTGDLTRHGGALRVRVDVRVYQLNNWFGDPIDPRLFPLVLQFHDYDGGSVPASVYVEGPGLPPIAEGWRTYEFIVPDPTSAVLPPGWGGTGDEDPVTFEPRLPADRTYTSVLRSVDMISVSTFRPGWAYISNFWEMGFDNIVIEIERTGCDPDYNQDGNTDQDDVRYLVDVVAGGPNPTGRDPDWNGDGNVDQDDVRGLVDHIAGGVCP